MQIDLSRIICSTKSKPFRLHSLVNESDFGIQSDITALNSLDLLSNRLQNINRSSLDEYISNRNAFPQPKTCSSKLMDEAVDEILRLRAQLDEVRLRQNEPEIKYEASPEKENRLQAVNELQRLRAQLDEFRLKYQELEIKYEASLKESTEKEKRLQAINAALRALKVDFKAQEREVIKLRKALAEPKKNNQNSSLSSNDITNPKDKDKDKSKKQKEKSQDKPSETNENGSNESQTEETEKKKEDRKKIGGQPGHAPHVHEPFEGDDVIIVKHAPPEGVVCSCGNDMVVLDTGEKRQDQYELKEIPIERITHIAEAYVCPGCGKIHGAKIPNELSKMGLVGERLTALLATLNTSGRVTIRGLEEILAAMGAKVSNSCIVNALKRAGRALDEPFEELSKKLKEEPVLHIDETSHKENGKRLYLWGFNTLDYVVFRISNRSTDILKSILTNDYKGFIVCDFYTAYRAYCKNNPNASLAFCHAHLIRDLKFLAEHKLEPELKAFGEAMLEIEKKLFELWHQFCEDPTEENHDKLRRCAEELRSKAFQAPELKKAQAIANRFVMHPDGYTNFVDNEGVSPTNNLSERAFRFAAIARKISQGTRSEADRKARERLWTAFGTCRKRKKSLFDYLNKALRAWSRKLTVPSLLE